MKITDIIFWLIVIFLAALGFYAFSVTIFVSILAISLWKKIYEIENKVSTSLIRLRSEANNKFNIINNKLNNIQSLVKK